MGQQVEDIAIAHDQKLPIYRVSSHSAMGQHEEENPITIVDEFKTSEKQNRSFREKQRKIKGYRPSPAPYGMAVNFFLFVAGAVLSVRSCKNPIKLRTRSLIFSTWA